MSRAACKPGLAALAALCLAGCVAGPRYAPPLSSAPAAWRAADVADAARSPVSAREIKDDAWWTGFGDPELTSLIERALADDLDARQAVLRIEEARAQRRVAGAGAWPSVDLDAAYADTRISQRTATSSIFNSLSGGSSAGGPPPGVTGALPGLVNPFPQYQYGLTGSWEIDLFGRVRRQVEAADADVSAAVEDARAVRVSLMAEVAAAYIDLRSAQARLAIAQETVATSQALLKLATDARGADIGDDLDVASAKAALASAEAAAPPLQSEIVLDESQLAQLLAVQPGALDSELDAPKPVPPVPPQVPIGLPSELARRRPDIREAEARLHAATALKGVAVADLYPRIAISGAGGLEASNPASLADWAARYFTIGPALDLPVFDAGRRVANVRIADVRVREAALAYAETVLRALHEADDAVSAYAREQSRRSALAEAVAQARAALGLAQARYRAGAVSFRYVLDAEEQLQGAELTLTLSTAATSEDLVLLYRALGGGWGADPG